MSCHGIWKNTSSTSLRIAVSGKIQPSETSRISRAQGISVTTLAVSMTSLPLSFTRGSEERQEAVRKRIPKKNKIVVSKIAEANLDLVCLLKWMEGRSRLYLSM